MSSSLLINTQRYAAEAKIAAATAKVYAQSNSEYADDSAASATEASGYATNAAASATLAEQYYDYATTLSSFFIGALSSAPTTRTDGTAVQVGDMYKNTTDNVVYSYNSDGSWSSLTYDETKTEELYSAGLELYSVGSEFYDYSSSQIENIGTVLPTTVSIFNQTQPYSSVQTRGFYEAGDGGSGLWILTGNIDVSQAGTHLITSAKVYNNSGYEYVLNIKSGMIDARANGAVSFTSSQQYTDLIEASDDIVCTGQAINGIVSLVGDSLDSSSNSYVDTVDYSLQIILNTGYYRIGKQGIKIKSHVSYKFGRASFQVIACPSYTYAATGNYLNALEHSVSDIEAVYTEIGELESWSALSATNFEIDGGFFFGDQSPSITESSCSAGYGILGLNIEYSNIKNIYLSNFLWPIMARQINSMTDGSGNAVIESSVVTSAIGNFYGINFENVRCNKGRKGLAYIDIDWCTWKGGSLCDSADWINGVDATAPDYFLVDRGAAFSISGCNLTVQHSSLTNLLYQPAVSVVYSKAKGSSYISNYLEWTESFLTISKEGFNTESQMGHGITIDNIGGQYRPTRTWKYVTFEDGCFGEFDSSNAWTDPTKYSSQGAYRGVSFLRLGSPVKNETPL